MFALRAAVHTHVSQRLHLHCFSQEVLETNGAQRIQLHNSGHFLLRFQSK